jgi:hypothetical protein
VARSSNDRGRPFPSGPYKAPASLSSLQLPASAAVLPQSHKPLSGNNCSIGHWATGIKSVMARWAITAALTPFKSSLYSLGAS